MQRLVLASLAVAVVACAGQVTQARQGHQATTARPKISYANIGGYLLAYECTGTGRLTVILEAGYTASGISTYGPVIFPALAQHTRVCIYDRAGDGLSDARPASVRPLPAPRRPGRGSPESVDTLIELILLACPASLAAM